MYSLYDCCIAVLIHGPEQCNLWLPYRTSAAESVAGLLSPLALFAAQLWALVR